MQGNLVCAVTELGAAHLAGIQPGDRLLAIDGRPILDVIDYQTFIVPGSLRIALLRGGQQMTVLVKKDDGESLGITFETMLMDETRVCRNKCVFCFVDQMPEDCRESLYVKDDDWRLSLLTGNYITLTNVSEEEFARLLARKVSPIYVSVHATDPEVRVRMMKNPGAARILTQLRAIQAAGIRFNAQIVLCPGYNDGPVLGRTLDDLMAFSNLESVAVVPVGLTKFRDGLAQVRPLTQGDAQAALDIIQRKEYQGRAFASDELYLRAGAPLPAYEDYCGFPQIENGVGLLRVFEEEYLYAREEAIPPQSPRRVVVVSGTSGARFTQEMLDRHPIRNVEAKVLPVENEFFGSSVTVTGLLAGSDVIRACKDIKADAVLLWGSMLRAGEDVFLDDTTLDEVTNALKSPVIVCRSGGDGLVEALTGQETT